MDNLPISNLSETEIANITRAEKIGNVILKSRLTMQYNPYTPADQTKAVAAAMEIFNAAGIETAIINDCYLNAKVCRIRAMETGDEPPRLDVEFICSQARAVREMRDKKNKTLRLPNTRPPGCAKCYGTGRVFANWDLPQSRNARRIMTAEICNHLDDDGNPAFDTTDANAFVK